MGNHLRCHVGSFSLISNRARCENLAGIGKLTVSLTLLFASFASSPRAVWAAYMDNGLSGWPPVAGGFDSGAAGTRTARGLPAPGAPGGMTGAGTPEGAPDAATLQRLRESGYPGYGEDRGMGLGFGIDALGPQGLPPLQANLFQLYLQQTTGKIYQLYGRDYFSRKEMSAGRESAAVPADYALGAGDEIGLKIYGSTMDVDQRLVVDRQGMLVLPKIGPVSVAGVKFGDLEGYLKKRISRVLTNFHLYVTMGQLRALDIYVVGQARRPGKYTLNSLSTVVSALFATGGPTNNGSLRGVQLVRDGKVVTSVDVYDFLSKGDASKDRRLQPGDVINIPPIGPQVALTGAIPSPAIYELSTGAEGTSLKEIITLAGGLSVQTSTFEATLERVEKGKEKPLHSRKFALNEEGLKTTLQDGDLLTFLAIKPDFQNSVTLRVMRASPIRVPIGPNSKVKDVLPNKEALLTSDYFFRRFNVDGDLEPIEATLGGDNSFAYDGTGGGAGPGKPAASSGKPVGKQTQAKAAADSNRENDLRRRLDNHQRDDINWDYAVIERLNPADFTTQLFPFNLGKVLIEGNAEQNLALQPGDTITVFSQNDIKLPVEHRTQVVRLQGEVNAPGIYQIEQGETLTHLIQRAGGLTSKAYVFGTELSRRTVRERQKENIKLVVRQMEAQLSGQSASSLAKVTPGADMTQLTAMNERNMQAARAQIERLKAASPNGRIALEIDPEDPKFPEFPLEGEDDITIPTRPGYVSAVGAVYNENVLIYHKDRRVSAYLDVAGVMDSADEGETFIVRADGSIVSRASRNVKRAVIFPGDTIVVPEKYYEESGYSVFMRGLKDWTQVIFQLGLGAAAIHSLK